MERGGIQRPATTKRAFKGALNHAGAVSGRTGAHLSQTAPKFKSCTKEDDDPFTISAARGTKAVRQPREARTAALPDIETFEDEGR